MENKRIYATLHKASAIVNLKLSVIDQSLFCSFNGDAIYQVPNKWGLQGWITFDLEKVPNEIMYDAMNIAYRGAFKLKQKKK